MVNQPSARFDASTITMWFSNKDLPSIVVFVVTKCHQDDRCQISSTRNERKLERCHLAEIHANEAIVKEKGEGMWREKRISAGSIAVSCH